MIPKHSTGNKTYININQPRHSMYGIFTYIGVVWGVNVGIYGIHGVSGYIINQCYIYESSWPSRSFECPPEVGTSVENHGRNRRKNVVGLHTSQVNASKRKLR